MARGEALLVQVRRQGGEQVVNLPVYPAGMLVEPFVRHLATALRARIDSVIAARQTAR